MMNIAVHNWRIGELTAPKIGTWSGVSGFQWNAGEQVYWPSGDAVVIASASELLPKVPSGTIPNCTNGSVYYREAAQCAYCAPEAHHNLDAWACFDLEPC